jgi:predicted lipoprotein with Yx(FWY)xxD motif
VLYLFGGDRNGLSRCSGACATAWPPYLSSQGPKAGMGVNPALLGTLRRPDGTIQVTYNGHPLYYYQGDMSAGSHHGQGMKAFGAQWYLVAANGSKISKT